MKLQTILLTTAAFALAACNPAAETPAPEVAPPADIAAVAPESGPAAENTTDTLASAPPADAATTPWRRSASLSCSSALRAPRSLKLPVRCK